MAVSKKIVDLTRLALQDRVLTYTERQTIVKVALEEGVSEQEINAFMDNMLAQRLKSFTKEELRNCPSCGGQIPLISDQCLYCGTFLNQQPENVYRVDVVGEEADIIRSENEITQEQEPVLKNCPDCGAPFPMLSNICTHCGHVHHELRESDFNVKSLIENIEDSNETLLNAKPYTFGDVLMAHKGKIAMLSVVTFFIANQFYDLTIMVLLITILGGIGLTGLMEKSLASEFDRVYFQSLSAFNEYTRYIKVFYGQNAEAKQYLSQFGDTIRNAARRRIVVGLYLALFVIIVLLLPFVPLLFILF